MKHIKFFEEYITEKKPAGAPDWHDSDAPDAEGRFKELGIKDLAAWLIKTRKKDLKKISGSITQQIVFNRKKDPEYAEKMEKVRKEVYRQLGREDLLEDDLDLSLEKESPYKEETLLKYKKEYEAGKDIPFGVKTSLIAQGMIPHEGGPHKGKLKKTELYEAEAGVLSVDLDINKVLFGNQPKEFVEFAESETDPIKNWFIKEGLAEKIRNEAPANDSEKTQEDLRILVEKTSKATFDDIAFARYADDDTRHLPFLYLELLKEKGHEETFDEFHFIDRQTESLLFYLKDIINRPRPSLLGKYYNYLINPLIRSDAMTAAYPSGHALTAFVMSEYYSQKHPELREEILALGEKVAESRELVGIHFPSDTEISREISKIIFENNLLKPYKLEE